MRILIVDDLYDARQVLRYMVENNGHEAIEAENGLDALTIAKSTPPDLIISDALMPVMDGFKFLRAIKQDPELYAIPPSGKIVSSCWIILSMVQRESTRLSAICENSCGNADRGKYGQLT